MRERNGYQSYRGRVSPRRVLGVIILVLAVVLAAVVALYLYLQRYVVYTDEGARFELPFDLPFLSDDDRVELALGLFPLFSLIRIHAEFLGRVDCHIIQFPYKGLVIGCTVDSRTLLRGEGRPYDKTVLIIAPPQETIPEVGHFLQHRIDRIFQQLFILRIEILVIHVLHCPR